MVDILFEDEEMIVVKKPAGLATQTARMGEKDLVSEIKGYLYDKNPQGGEPYLGIIHRLDQPVEGVLVFAKNPAAAAALSTQVNDGTAKKEYFAVVCAEEGKLEPGVHTLVDYLKKDGKNNISKVVRAKEKDAKRAELSYSEYGNKENGIDMIRDRDQIKADLHLVKIRLYTGRHHQIRVQMANAGLPLLGDVKYGKPIEGYHGGLNLCAYRLTIYHPKTHKELKFRITPSNLQIL